MIQTWRIPIGKLTHDLQSVHTSSDSSSLDKVSQLLPAGAYTTLRTYSLSRVIVLDDHFDRLEETAYLTERVIQINRVTARSALREALSQSGDGEKRIRITLDLEQNPGDLYLSIEPLHTPSMDDYARGVNVVTRNMQRMNAKAKQTSFIPLASEIRAELPIGINEALMVDCDGIILEGLSSNFFAVIEREIWTVEAGVLNGITRRAVVARCERAQIPLHLTGVQLGAINRLEEAFITSSSRAVLPVVQINDQRIGTGAPGPVTRSVAELYAQWVAKAARPV